MGVLSTISADGRPWGSAVYFIADEDFNFYFVTKADTFKYKNLENQPMAALTIADEPSQTTVQVSGSVAAVPVDQEFDIIFRKLEANRPKNDNEWVPPVYKIHKGNYMVLCLTPEKLQFADYRHFKTDIHHDYIETIIG